MTLKQFPLLIISLAWLTGIALYFLVPFALPWIATLLLILSIQSFIQKSKRSALALIVILMLLAGAKWSQWRVQNFNLVVRDISLIKQVAQVVSSTTHKYQNQAYFDLDWQGHKLRLRGQWQGNELSFGDRIVLSGQIISSRNDLYNEAGFLAAHNASGILLIETIHNIESSGNGNPIMRNIFALRSYLLDRMNQFGNPEQGLIASLVLGEQGGLSQFWRDNFRAVGLSHIMVASGSNVMIVVWILSGIIAGLGFILSRLLLIGALLNFMIIAGADASIVRAVLLYMLIILSQFLGTRIHWPTFVSFVAAVMSFINPWILVYDLSFQLSFAAVLGLLVFTKPIAERLNSKILKTYLASTIAAQILTLPIILFYFGDFSLISPLANVLVLPVIPLLTMMSLIALVFNFTPLNWAVQGLASILLTIVFYLAKAPGALLHIDPRNFWMFVVVLSLIIVLALYLRLKKPIQPIM